MYKKINTLRELSIYERKSRSFVLELKAVIKVCHILSETLDLADKILYNV